MVANWEGLSPRGALIPVCWLLFFGGVAGNWLCVVHLERRHPLDALPAIRVCGGRDESSRPAVFYREELMVEFDGEERIDYTVQGERTGVLVIHRVDEYVVSIGLGIGTGQNGADPYPSPRKILCDPALDTLEVVHDRLDRKVQ